MHIPSKLKRLGDMIVPPPDLSADGRDQWPSRGAFLLAAMGGCAGQGNLLRYPSVLYNNYGLQWFIPYLLSVTLVAVPALVLEIAIGQAYRGGTVVAFNSMHPRLRGLGLGPVLVSLIVVMYFTVNLAWIMVYFRNSFISPLPWEGRIEEFYNQDVLRKVDPVGGALSQDGKSVLEYATYPGLKLIGETVGWSAFVWFLIWGSIFRGVGMTGRVVYFTMGLPIVTTIILVGRSVSLPGAGAGLRLVWATWRGSELASGAVWQRAVGQVFFSTGVGFGYFTSYASYNQKHSNAVMDAILICGSNVLFENVAALAIFGIIGNLQRWPDPANPLGAFVVGFLTLPQAVLEMPGANFWAVLLFFTLIVLGFSSAFVMLDVVATLLVDAGVRGWNGRRVSRPTIVSLLTLMCFLLCLPYCTEFGYYLLDGIDRWLNGIVLIAVVWAESVCSTSIYRCADVKRTTGKPAFVLYQLGYFGAQIFGIALAQGTGNPVHGVAAGLASWAGVTLISVVLGARTMQRAESAAGSGSGQQGAPRFWRKSPYLASLWYLALYSGNQLRRDLNAIVGQGRNWAIPAVLPVLLRYVSGPVLAIILSFAFPEFHTLRYDPMMIAGFVLAMLGVAIMLGGLVAPRYYAVFVPKDRREEGQDETVVNETKLDKEKYLGEERRAAETEAEVHSVGEASA